MFRRTTKSGLWRNVSARQSRNLGFFLGTRYMYARTRCLLKAGLWSSMSLTTTLSKREVCWGGDPRSEAVRISVYSSLSSLSNRTWRWHQIEGLSSWCFSTVITDNSMLKLSQKVIWHYIRLSQYLICHNSRLSQHPIVTMFDCHNIRLSLTLTVYRFCTCSGA